MRVIVLGDLVVDVVAKPSVAVARDSDTAALVHMAGGGSGANAAAWMAAAGMPVSLVARVGDDLAGRLLAADLETAGVEPLLAVDPGSHTGGIVVLVEADGRRTMLTDRGASALLTPEDLPAERFTAPGHLHLSGYTLLGEASRAAGLAALRLARDAGMSTSVTPGTVAPLREAGARRFLEWTEGVGCCVANRDEAAALVAADHGAQPAELAAALARHYAEAIVTLGGDGAIWAGRDETVVLPAVQGEVTDTTGAGDALAAGALSAWLGGATRAEALAAGLALAARAIARPGARPRARPSAQGG